MIREALSLMVQGTHWLPYSANEQSNRFILYVADIDVMSTSDIKKMNTSTSLIIEYDIVGIRDHNINVMAVCSRLMSVNQSSLSKPQQDLVQDIKRFVIQ